MNRRSIPAYEMSEVGQEFLRREGFVVTSLVNSIIQDPRRLQPHYHDFFQFMLLRGTGLVMHDFQETRVTGMNLFFLRPGQVHTMRPGRGFCGTTVSFTQAFFDHRATPPSALFELPFFFPAQGIPLLKVPAVHQQRFAGIFTGLQQEFDMAQSNAAEVLRASLRILFVQTLRIVGAGAPAHPPSRPSLLVRQFHLAVENHFRKEFALQDYARELGVSANHLNDTVLAQTGHPAGYVIRKRRLLDAQRLLSHSDLSVAEIGYELGFADPSYFGRFFRRETGQTPVSFRNAIREKYQAKPK
jgi:AraC-like DNA-binding protein